MSSTNRSNARQEHIADYYVTPVEAIEKFLKEFVKTTGIKMQGLSILDPAAGGDNKHEMSYPISLHNLFENINITTIDIREDSKAEIKTDYLNYDFYGKKFDVVITNPPFNKAQDMITKALSDVKDGGWVIMLLRLNYFEGLSREKFWNENMAKFAFVHRRRMRFTDAKTTDSVAYMHCCWHKGENPEFCKLKII